MTGHMTERKGHADRIASAPVRRREMTGPRGGLLRQEAADYIRVGTTKFDEMVKDGRVPRPNRGSISPHHAPLCAG